MGLLLLMGGADYNVRSELFSQNEQGLWLDPSQMSTLYQDSNGVTPCTAAGDPVGLILDQSRGGLSQIGADLVTNGTFAADTDWTKGANWTIGSGVATKTGGAANNLTQTIGSTAAAWYRISMDVTRSAGTLTVSLGTSGTSYAITATGSYTFFILAGSGTQTLTLAGDSSFAGTVDNVVVRNVPGNHASQSSSSARPTLARIPSSGRRNLLTRSEEFDNAVWLKNNVNVTANTVTSPSGSMADLCIPTVDNTTHFIRQISLPSNTYTFSCYLKAAGETQVSLWLASASVAGIFTLTGAGSFSGAGGLSAASIEHVGDGWYLCQVWHNVAGTTVHVYGRSGSAYIGNGTDGFYIADAQAEATASLSRTTYQRVTSTHDVTEAGRPDCWYLDTSGSKWMQTNAIDFDTWTQDARRNLLTETESFGAAAWTKVGASIVENIAADPFGNLTADRITVSVQDIERVSQVALSGQSITGTTFTGSVWVKGEGANIGKNVRFRVKRASGGTLADVIVNHTLTGDWVRLSGSFTGIASNTGVSFGFDGGAGFADGWLIWGAQLETGTLTTYQRVGTDEMTVIAGVRKLSDAAAMIGELSSNATTSSGAFYLLSGQNATDGWWTQSKGTAASVVGHSTNIATSSIETAVVSSTHDISGDLTTIRRNSVAGSNATADKGSGNFGNHILYLFSRAGTSIFFNGHLFHLIIRGKTTEGSKLTGAEKLTARKTGITI